MIKLLVCDDDETVVSRVLDLISDFENKNKIKFEIDTKSSGDFILKDPTQYDIAIVDIELPGIDGLVLSQKLKINNPDTIIIILTSFQSYLDNAMKIRVFRYLSKPINKNRFYLNLTDAIEEYKLISKTIPICCKDDVYVVKTKDILYMETKTYGSLIVTVQGSLKTNIKITDWRERINQDNCFVFSHNSFLVNLQNVISFNKTQVVLRKNDSETVSIYMSQRKYAEFKNKFFKFAGGLK